MSRHQKNQTVPPSSLANVDCQTPRVDTTGLHTIDEVPVRSTLKRVLCLWFPNWSIQRLVVSQPELRRQRVVLFRRDSRRGQVISAASPLAMQGGVCVDMPLSEAKSLLRRGGEFHVFEQELDADLQALEVLADSLEPFSPIVGLESIDARELKRGRRPDSLLLEVTGLAHLFGDEHQLARQLLTHCDGKGYLPRIAIAETVGAAWGLAHHFAGQYFSQCQQPLVLKAGTQDLIDQLPVESLRLEATVADTLYQLGVKTIGQLRCLSRNDLARRFGKVIHQRLDQISGAVDESVVARRKPTEFLAEQLLEYPTNHRETIEVITARLIGEICGRMRTRQRGALEWTIGLVCQSGSPIEFRVNLFQPTAQTEQVMPLVEMQLEQALSPHTRRYRKKPRAYNRKRGNVTAGGLPPQPVGEPAAEKSSGDSQFHRYTTIQVQEIQVRVSSDVLLAQQQRQLFDENPRLDRQSLAHLINRLANRLGASNVVYPTLLSGAQPEYSFRLKPLVDPSRKHQRRKTKPIKKSHALARPLRLFHPPVPIKAFGLARVPDSEIRVEDRVGESSLPRQLVAPASPALLQTRAGGQQKIVATWGPERIETGWWRGLTVCRDYWRVETEAQQHYWVYRDLRNGDWFLHGEF